MTDRYAWLGNRPDRTAVALVAQAPYHLAELEALADQLLRKDVAAAILVPVIRWKPLYSLRPTVRRLARTVATSTRGVSAPVGLRDLVASSSAVVVMNDWGVPRQLVEASKEAGVPTFGWVEGVQDYDDVDTGLQRHAYKRVDHVFALGPASCELLGPDRSTAVGSARLSALWASEAPPMSESVLINSNFTYGVLTRERGPWVDGAIEACSAERCSWTLSRHVAERGLSRHRVSSRRIADLLPESGRLVSRFSTVNLDALALGVQLVYHNPHGERVDMFADPDGAFALTRSIHELREVLAQPVPSRKEVRRAAEPFLLRHVELDASTTPAERAASVIASWVDKRSGHPGA